MTSWNGNIFRVTGPLWGIHRSQVNSPHKSQWRGALMFSLICAWTNGCANNRDAGDLTRHNAHYGVTVMTVIHILPDYFTVTGAKQPWWIYRYWIHQGLKYEWLKQHQTMFIFDDMLHYPDVTMTSSCPKSPATRLCVQQLVEANGNGSTKAPTLLAFWWIPLTKGL